MAVCGVIEITSSDGGTGGGGSEQDESEINLNDVTAIESTGDTAKAIVNLENSVISGSGQELVATVAYRKNGTIMTYENYGLMPGDSDQVSETFIIEPGETEFCAEITDVVEI